MQVTYQGTIIFRMLGENEKRMKEFHEDYKENCLINAHRESKPKKVDYKYFELYQSGLGINTIAKKEKSTYAKVQNGIFRVMREKLSA